MSERERHYLFVRNVYSTDSICNSCYCLYVWKDHYIFITVMLTSLLYYQNIYLYDMNYSICLPYNQKINQHWKQKSKITIQKHSTKEIIIMTSFSFTSSLVNETFIKNFT